MEQTFGYDLSRTCDEIRPGYRHVETCKQTVPEAILSHKRTPAGTQATPGFFLSFCCKIPALSRQNAENAETA